MSDLWVSCREIEKTPVDFFALIHPEEETVMKKLKSQNSNSSL
jgi:hypothetical protein